MKRITPKRQSIEYTTLIRRYHILDVNKRILSSSLLQQLQSLADEITQIQPFSLVVLDFVTSVGVAIAEDVENWQNLTVVGD